MNNLRILEEIDLKQFTTFRMGPKAQYFAVVKSLADLEKALAFAKDKQLPVLILGSGSNLILSQENILEAVVIKMEIAGFEVLADDDKFVTLKIGAGENWDAVVRRAVEMNLVGIEAMSWIPGTAGATPIQNVGAYGREIADVLVSLDAYEKATGKVRAFTREECEFKYRDSAFKNKLKDQFVITSITIQLSKFESAKLEMPNYPGVKKYFEEKEITEPSLQQIRQAIIDIRNIKLPDPREVASVGSFFKNPIVTSETYEAIKEKYPNVIAFALETGEYKIGAGWILETLGLKGKEFDSLMFYPNNALVVVNKGGANYSQLMSLIYEVQKQVKDEFGIRLEMEPLVI